MPEVKGESMAGRKLSFDPSTALHQMMLVFWEKGFNGTSIDDLCRAVGVPKPSIYATFGDKETILVQALELYTSRTPQKNSETWRLDLPLRERLVELIMETDRCLAPAGQAMPTGCFMVNTITEFTGVSERVDEAIRRLTKVSGDGMERFFALAVERGELRKGANPKMLAAQVGIFSGGLSVVKKKGLSRKKARELAEEFVGYLLGAEGK